MKRTIEKLRSRELAAALKVQSVALLAVREFMAGEGALEMMPVIISPVTDPLCHSVLDASISYYGQKLQITKSMILHKSIAMSSPHLSKIFIVSPNVRLETKELKGSARHLLDFSQLDMELQGAKMEEFMEFLERLVASIGKKVSSGAKEELEFFGRRLPDFSGPYKRFDSVDLLRKHGEDYEKIVSTIETKPFWITNLKREFYDRESPRGVYRNYDLVWPGGFGEALSGGEREWEYKEILRKLRERKQSPKSFSAYVSLARQGLLRPSAGGGLGIERLVRFLCGTETVSEIAPFGKAPGERIVI